MTNISTLVPALKRGLAVPGTFATVFPNTGDTDLTGALADGFAEAQLFGFFKDVTLTSAGPDWTTDPDLSTAGGALVVIYTCVRAIRAQLRNLKTMHRYKAGPVEYEDAQAATVLKAELDFMTKQLDDLLTQAEGAARGSAGLATVFDNYRARNIQQACGAFYAYEFPSMPIAFWR